MTDLAPTGPHDLTDRLRYAEALAAADLLPAAYRRKPANVLLAMEYGAALGLSPLHAIQGLHVIEGRPTASAQLIAALVRRAGHRLRVTGDDQHAVVEVRRADDPEYAFRSEWSLDRARTAGLLGKGTWKQYPAAMLKARAITEAARDACPEALAGIAYTAEELGSDDGASDPDWSTPPAPALALPAAPRPQPPPDEPDVTAASLEPVEEDRPDSADTASGGAASKAQLLALNARMEAAGLASREERLTFASRAVGRSIASALQLTATEAGDLLEALGTSGDSA